jgi:hypothetical protein
MSAFQDVLRCYGVIISYVLRGAPAQPCLANREGEFETYIDAPDWPVAFQATERMAVALPEEWRSHITGVFKLGPQRLRQYRSDRYFIRFADNDHRQLLALLLRKPGFEPLASLIRGSDGSASGESLRPDRSGSDVGQYNSAILVLFDLCSHTELVDASTPTTSDPFDIVVAFRTALGQMRDTFMVLPSRLGDFLFTKGPTGGTLLDSVPVLRLTLPPSRNAISVPIWAIDWVDFADNTYIVADLCGRIAKEPLIAESSNHYLQSLASTDLPSIYDQFTLSRTTAISEYLNGRETLDEIAAKTRAETFLRGIIAAASASTPTNRHCSSPSSRQRSSF